MTRKCSNGHNQQWQCHAGAPPVCIKCENDRKQAEKKVQRDLDAKIKREAKVQKHLKELAKLDEQMAQITQTMEDLRLDSEQRAVLEQKRKDLEAAKERANVKQYSPPGDPPGVYHDDRPIPRNQAVKKTSNQSATPASLKSTPSQHSNLREHIKIAVEHNKSRSKTEWQRQKDQENASNPAIDDIMEMIGLENTSSSDQGEGRYFHPPRH
jgi:DNA repair exonuclease SbcCD ATPase subunit